MRLLRSWTAVAVFVASALGAAQDNGKSPQKHRAKLRTSLCELRLEKANSLLARDARWIEGSYPESALFDGTEWSKHWLDYKAAKLRIAYELHDCDTHIRGDVAWLTSR